MLQHYSSQKERNRFIERLEILLLESFGIHKRGRVEETRIQMIKDFYNEKVQKSTFFMSKKAKEQIQAGLSEIKERHIQVLEMLKDASKLNSAILSDMEKNPEEYINLLKRKVFNPHKCNIEKDPYREKSEERQGGIHLKRQVQCGNFALLYAFLANWIKDEDITIMECYAIYQRFGFPCNVIKPSQEQKILIKILSGLISSGIYEPTILDAVKHLEVRENKLQEAKAYKICVGRNNSYVKLFVEYWDYDWCYPLTEDNSIWKQWNEMSLEEIVEQGRQGTGPVTRTKIPWQTRAREIRHTFLGGSEYAYYDEPAPEKIRYSYFKDFKEILKLNVHNGVRAETKYEDGREIGYTLFIDEQDIINLPFEIDWKRVERWTWEEEKQFREEQERERRAEEESRKKYMRKYGYIFERKNYGREEK